MARTLKQILGIGLLGALAYLPFLDYNARAGDTVHNPHSIEVMTKSEREFLKDKDPKGAEMINRAMPLFEGTGDLNEESERKKEHEELKALVRENSGPQGSLASLCYLDTFLLAEDLDGDEDVSEPEMRRGHERSKSGKFEEYSGQRTLYFAWHCINKSDRITEIKSYVALLTRPDRNGRRHIDTAMKGPSAYMDPGENEGYVFDLPKLEPGEYMILLENTATGEFKKIPFKIVR